MDKKDNESRNGFLRFSENLSELLGPVFGWIWKHSIAILLVVAAIGFVWRSIHYHYIDNQPLGQSLSSSTADLIFIYAKWLLIGFASLICLLFIGAVLKSIGQKNAKQREELEIQTINPDQASADHLSLEECEAISNDSDEYIAPEVPRGIDEDLLRKYLKGSFMGKPYYADKTNFDGVVDILKIIQIGYRKGAKNGKGYTDKDIMQVASLLYHNKYMGHTGKFNVWCTSLFMAMNIDIPAEIRKPDPEKKITDLFLFLNR